MIKSFLFSKKLLVSAKTYCEERMKNPAAKLCGGGNVFFENRSYSFTNLLISTVLSVVSRIK
jgi:hypothetical protein